MERKPESITEFKKEMVVDYCQPLQFDPNDSQFLVGSSEIQAVAPEQVDTTIFDLLVVAELRQDPEKAEEYLVLDTFGNVVVLPPMREWLFEIAADEERRRDTELSVAEVIRDVYTSLSPEDDQYVSMGSYDHMSFNANITEHGEFMLTTLGNCACLGPEGSSRATDDDYYLEYCFHNIDAPRQALSLYAGAGYLSWLARR